MVSSISEGIIEKDDLVVVSGGWGCVVFVHIAKKGNEQVCPNGRWLGFGDNGGYCELVSSLSN
jgi:propanol-preferring alcohol dehydrogenase